VIYLFHSQEEFSCSEKWCFWREGRGDGDSPGAPESVGSLDASREAGVGVLFDDLRTVAPGFSLSFSQCQPSWLCAHLWRVTGGEAL